jgi:hypothetical protein
VHYFGHYTVAFPSCLCAGIAQSVQRLPTRLTVRGCNPCRGEIFPTCPVETALGPANLLYSGYRLCFPGAMWPSSGVDHPPSSSSEFRKRVEFYLYSHLELRGLFWDELFFLDIYVVVVNTSNKYYGNGSVNNDKNITYSDICVSLS